MFYSLICHPLSPSAAYEFAVSLMNFSLVFLICSLSFSDITLCFNSFRTFLALDDFFGVLDLMLDSKFKSFLLSRIHLICSECFYLLAHVFRNPDYSEFFLYYVHSQCWID